MKEMARKKIREFDSKRLLKEHLKRLTGIDLQIRSAQVFPEPPISIDRSSDLSIWIITSFEAFPCVSDIFYRICVSL